MSDYDLRLPGNEIISSFCVRFQTSFLSLSILFFQKSTFPVQSQPFQYKVNLSSNEVNHFRKTVNFTSEEGQQKQYRKTLALKIV